MPLAIDPEFRFPVALDSDGQKPADQRPTFYFRAATAREWRRILEAEGTAERSALEQLDAVLDALRLLLVDWRNMPARFDPASLEDVIGPFEAFELLGKIVAAMRLSAEQKKTSDDSSS